MKYYTSYNEATDTYSWSDPTEEQEALEKLAKLEEVEKLYNLSLLDLFKINGDVRANTFNDIYYFGNCVVDNNKKIVTRNGELVLLTYKESSLLMFFIEHRSQLLTREEIIKNVWPDDYQGHIRVIDDIKRNLKVKLPEINIKTVYGQGYRLDF
jgi:DNA-binding response OmpR family regulator